MRRGKYQRCVCGHQRREHDVNAGKCNKCECSNFRRAPKGQELDGGK